MRPALTWPGSALTLELSYQRDNHQNRVAPLSTASAPNGRPQNRQSLYSIEQLDTDQRDIGGTCADLSGDSRMLEILWMIAVGLFIVVVILALAYGNS
jgi:hypothetical protein